MAAVLLSGCSLLSGSDDGGAESGPEYALCLTDDDCDLGREFCHPNLKICSKYGCVGDQDCLEGQECDLEYFRCVDKKCALNEDCELGKYCDPTTLQCLFGCRPESCRDHEFCDAGGTPRACRPRGCSLDGDCGAAEYCLVERVSPAQYDPPAEEGGDPVRIVVGTCRVGCRVGEGDACPRGEFCDVRTRRCGQLSCEGGVEDCAQMSALGPDPECDADVEVCAQPVYCDPDSAKCRFGCIGELYADEDPVSCADSVLQYCSVDPPRRQCRLRTCRSDAGCTRVDTFCDVPRGDAVGLCRTGCRPGACRDPIREKCDVDTRRCEVTGCDANADCDECLTAGECVGAAPHYCDTQSRQCRSGCRDNTDCATGRSCDPSSRTCVGDPCPSGNVDCLPNEYCAGDFGVRRCKSGCRLDDASTCPALQPCRPSDHVCGCDANPSVCPDGRQCRNNECVVPCVNQDICRPMGLVCDEEMWVCVEGCADDEFEDREQPIVRLDELDEEELPLLDEGLAICTDDVDWYALSVERGQSLTVRIDFEHAEGNLDLLLYAPGEDREAPLGDHCARRADGQSRCARGRAGFEQVSVPSSPVEGVWRLAVRRFDGRAGMEASPRTPYRLEFTLGPAPGRCVDDAYGEGAGGANDSQATATLIEPGLLEDLRLCDAPVDWYVVFLADDDELHATLRFQHAVANLDLAVYAPSEEFPEAIVRSACDELSCDDPDVEDVVLGPIPAGWSGLYALEVRSNQPGVPIAYSLESEVLRSGQGCEPTDAASEPNDDRLAATVVGAGLREATLCPAGDDDWHSVQVPARGSLRATLDYPSDRGFPRFDLRLRTSDGFTLDADAGAHGRKVVAHGGETEPMTYLVQVAPGTPSSVGEYDLLFEVAEPADCDDDDLEDNDSADRAALIVPGAQPARQICPWDEDWYRFAVGHLDDVALALDYAAAVDFRMQLVDSEGTPPPDCVDHLELNNPTPLVSCTSEDGDGSERIEVADLPEGTYALRVWASDDGFTPDVGQYHLNIDIVREPCDRETPALDHDQHDQGRGNNTRLLAEVLPDGLYPGLTLCRFDEDWYRVDVPPRRDLRALLTFEAGDGDLDLSLHDGDGEVLEGCGEGGGQPCAASGEAAADLTYQRDDGGLDQPVFLRVHGGDVLDPNGYALTMEFIEVDGGS